MCVRELERDAGENVAPTGGHVHRMRRVVPVRVREFEGESEAVRE